MGALFKLRPGEAVAIAPPPEDPLLAAATLLIAAGYKVIPPGRPGPDARRNSAMADDASDEEPAGEEPGTDGRAGDDRVGDDRVGDDRGQGQSRPLSAREIDVLALLAEGAPNKVIARRLSISVHTAKFHVASILAKLGAANRTDAIAIAMREGLVLI